METGCPHRWISPSDKSSKPAIIRRVVVFPQPEGPKNEKHSPSWILRLKSFTAVTVPRVLVVKRLVTCFKMIWSSAMFYTPFLSLVIWVTIKLQTIMIRIAMAARADAWGICPESRSAKICTPRVRV